VASEIEELASKYAIKNAADYGKAEFNSVLSKVIPKAKALKMSMPELKRIVEKAVKTANSLSKDELEDAYGQYETEFTREARLKAEQTSKPRIELDRKIVGEVVTRFPPEPNGYLHIGHAKQLFLSKAIAERYDGKIFLYFDDTNPKKEGWEYVDAIKEDTEWLGMKFDREYYASDNVKKIYDYARKLIKEGNAYVCECSQDEIKAKRFKGEECKHRSNGVFLNEDLFDGMLSGNYAENSAVVRMKLDMQAQNTTMRDPSILRVITTPHYRQGDKYAVWPTYYINTPVIDSINGVTDAIRDKNYELSTELYKVILKMLGLRVPEVHLIGRLKIRGNITSKRILNRMIAQKQISSYDDPRLLTIRALRRRGVLPKAIEKFALRFGLSKTESNVDMSLLLDENKKLIDPIAKHLFYVENPAKVEISNLTKKVAKLRVYPNREDYRDYEVNGVVYVSMSDVPSFKNGAIIALKDFAKVKIDSLDRGLVKASSTSSDGFDKVVQWVPQNHSKKCKVLIPSNLLNPDGSFNKDSLKESNGFVEDYAAQLNNGDIVQFERFGFCILDDKEKFEFIFISK